MLTNRSNGLSVFKAKNDYANINPVHSLNSNIYIDLAGKIENQVLVRLKNLKPRAYANQTLFLEAITKT